MTPQKILECLKSRWPLAQFGILEDSIEIIPPLEYNGRVSKGGISCLVKIRGYEKTKLSITHSSEMSFQIWIENKSVGQDYTLRSVESSFNSLGRDVFNQIESCHQ